MPRATYGYDFEFKVFHFAMDFASRMTGSAGSMFVMLFDEQGRVSQTFFDADRNPMRPHPWATWLEELHESDRPFFLFDPFDMPEYSWLQWRRLGRETMERLLGAPLEDADFDKGRPTAPDLDEEGRFPPTWGVMF